LAHHRFAWIHPFSNGNGRTVRALTYAMLIAQGFAVNRIINPTAVFCNNRDAYYENLAAADTGTDKGLLQWSQYVLSSLLEENKKIEKLLDVDFLRQKIIIPALAYAEDRKQITNEERIILIKAFEKGELMAADIKPIIKATYPNASTRLINKLLERKMLQKQKESGRKYLPSIHNNYLLRGFIESLRNNNFISFND
jgi:Fic family protein